MALINKYFSYTKDLIEKYGEKSVVMMQVGAFYEMYGLFDPVTNLITGSKSEEVCKLCELSLVRKNICVGKKNVMQSGFRDYQLDKYLKKLQPYGYTIAVYSQDEKAAGTTRSLTGIFSPGTYFSSDTNELTNNTMCIWIEKIQKTLVVGLSNIDIYTGKSFVFEYNQEFTTTPEAYDELERYISIYQPSELIVIHNLSEKLIDDILHFVDLKTECRHIFNKEDKREKQKITNCEKQTYQIEIMKKYFENMSIEENPNLSHYPIGTQSYCYLLDFMYYHNPDLTKKIQAPLFENCSERLILGNHSLKQLNIIDTSLSGSSGNTSSVSSFLNQCKTPMGKRKFQYMLLNPLTKPDILQTEYDFCEHLLCKNDIQEMRDLLATMRDLEKMSRKLALKRITPSECYHMRESLKTMQEVFCKIETDSPSNKYIFDKISKDVNTYSESICNIIEDALVVDLIKDKNTLTFDDNFIRQGFNKIHDNTVENWYDSYDILIGIQKYLNDKVAVYENTKNKKTPKKEPEYVKIHIMEKTPCTLICTARRATILKTQIKGSGIVNIPYYSRYSKNNKHFKLNLELVDCVKSTSSNMTIYSNEIKKICDTIFSSKNVMLDSLNRVYREFIHDLFKHIEKMDEIVRFVALVDYSYTRAHIAFKYNLCKPIINHKSDKAYFSAKGVRHILIESLLRDEHYVTNDLTLDSDNLGMLLYGTNAVGKSSFIKAIGINIIMAQAGFYVPCQEYNFYPYKHIFTRILGNDNLFKGLSSFAVEMLELKAILTMADKNSIILGDELCSGTESNSAMSIFISGIQHLYKEQSNFIFATHFHEITDFDEIRVMEKLSLNHMAVHYNREKDKLVYDRKLREGPGENMYGLEVCRALHLPSDFLENAHALRNKYNPSTGSILEWKTSRYNSKKLRGICEECKKVFSTEVHHVAHQASAKENGYIGSFHKNNFANLRSLCETCHLKEHNLNINS